MEKKKPEKMRVGVIMGGISSEKEVSLESGRNIFSKMDRTEFDPLPIFMDSRGRLYLRDCILTQSERGIKVIGAAKTKRDLRPARGRASLAQIENQRLVVEGCRFEDNVCGVRLGGP